MTRGRLLDMLTAERNRLEHAGGPIRVCAPKRISYIRAFYCCLLAAGKAKKLALTACMRKLLTILNAIMRTSTTWQQSGARANA